ncbi:ATP-binding protein [Saccharothrix deserti]|uniref:ATP-binding protein n=1 Tax=Saccharothrix deserti TaxID=2593674 RepID=UPI001EE49E2D|nr:LuxR C-terminal-related transcriptional regulator [Saccharothrix deserti]
MVVAEVPHPTVGLPAELTSFIGRRRELEQARRLLSANRLLTLTGAGGVGKTRLSLRIADQARRTFPDGVYRVELDALHDPSLLAQSVATRFGLRDASVEPAERLAEHLEDKRLLLVLDNCEHLVDACAILVGKLLGAAPGLRVLATSRHVLGIAGEQTMVVPPLPVPDDTDRTTGCEAVDLFADRAAAVLPGFTVDERNRHLVVRICRRLDGIPLAIELAAAWVRTLSLADIHDRLDDCLKLLNRGSRTAPSRQQTLAGAIDWSHDLCLPEERALWARLSVFAGGFDLDAAEAVGSGGDIAVADVIGLVAGLVDKSILIRDPDTHGRTARYRMLETIRQYGRARLASSDSGSGSGDEDAVRARHLEHYVRLAERYRSESFGPHQLDWVQRMIREHPNLRIAIEFALTGAGRVRAATDIASRLWNFWFSGGFLREGHRWLTRALEADPEPTRSRAEALWTCAFISVHLGEADSARRMLAECEVLAEQLDDDPLRAHHAEAAGLAALHRGEVPAACALLEQAVVGHREVGDLLGLADSLILLAAATLFSDDPRGADAAAEALELCETHDATWTRAYGLWAVAVHKWRAGDHRDAERLSQDAIRLQRAARDWTGLAYLLEALAWCTEGAGRPERAARLLGAATAVWRLSGAKTYEAPPYAAVDEQIAARATGEIGAEAFRTAFEEGKALGLEDVIAYALEEKTAKPASPDESLDTGPGLTRRQLEIAHLVAEGLSNKEIAARLVIALRTAETHVENVLTKLGFTSRTQIATWVAERRADR